jgi:hypothetical protein
MSSIGKILVVVNLVLSLVVLGAAGALLQRTETTKADFDRVSAEIGDVNQELEDARNDALAKERQLSQEKLVLQQENDDVKVARDNAQRTANKLELDNQQLRDDITKINTKLDALESTFQATNQRNTELVDTNAQLRTESMDAKAAQRDAETAMRQAQADLAAAQAAIADLEGQVAALTDDLNDAQNLLAIAGSQGIDLSGVVAAPPLDSSLVDVDNQYNFVILDKGSRDGVKTGFVFDVHRGGQWLGQVRVDKVYDDYSTAKIIEKAGEMRRFDQASTYL